MSMTTINYSCGHGSYETHLTGNRAKRESYVDWAESNKLCQSCYNDSVKKTYEARPQIAKVYLSTIKNEEYSAQIIIKLEGKIEENKENLIGDGFSYAKDSSDALFFGCFIFLNEEDLFDKKLAEKIKYKLKYTVELGYKIQIEFNVIDLERLRKNIRSENEIKSLKSIFLASNPQPKKPGFYPEEYWNGKFYGNEKYGFRIYIDGSEKSISKENVEAIQQYNLDISNWKKAFSDFLIQNLEKNTIKKSELIQDLESEKLGFLGLETLTGTEKQINIAIKIRKDFLSDIEKSDNVEFIDCLASGLPNDSQFWIETLALSTEEIVLKLRG